MKRILRFAPILVLMLAGTAARAVDVDFRVHMSFQIENGLFDPDTEFVDLAGSFNDWGTSPLTPLSDADGDSIYTVTVGGFTAGQTIEFKFRYNGLWDGREELPGIGNNRIYTVLSADNLVEVWYNEMEPGSGHDGSGELHWWNDTVFYEILVRSFYDSDGDGIGDLPGLTQQLDYLNDGDPATDDDLGITGIWLMPINDSPSYHGYDAIDYRAINPDYGTMADFEAFLAAAHARGIKVIVDYVMNHCSTQHPWFAASARNDPTYRDWFRWSATNPGETGPWGQDVWHWNNSGYYYGLFWSGMPDLNYETQAVKDEMFDTAAFWLEDVGVDGFRLDAVLYIDEDPGLLQTTPETLAFWHDFNAHIKSVEPDVLSVGEAWTGSSTVVQYVTEDRLDLCFEFDLSYAMIGAAGSGDAVSLGYKANQVYNLYPYLQYATFLTNHDQDRSFTVLGEDLDRAKIAASIYLTQPGVPFVYYGEEIGMTGSGDHLYIRSPMQWTDGAFAGFSLVTPWQAVNTNYDRYNVADEAQDPSSLLNWYKRLIHVRNGSSALRHGAYQPLTSSSGSVLAYLRRDAQQTLLCLINTSSSAKADITLTDEAETLIPGEHELVDLLDTTDAPTIDVTEDHEIAGLGLGGHEMCIYEFVGASAVDPDADLPPETGLRLEPNRPNPFNPSTTIHYDLPERSHVRIGVYDVAGREVTVLEDSVQSAGRQSVQWRGTDHRGQSVGAGVYVVRLETAAGRRQAKVTLLK